MTALESLFGLSGKVAVVTGGSRGIGKMAARGLLDAGARVYIVSRKAAAVEDAVRDLSAHGDVTGLSADLSTPEACRELAAEIGGREDALDILVNNAGATWGAELGEYPPAAWDKVFDLNVKAPFFLTEAFLPMLEKNASQDDPSRVINVGSIDGIHVPRHTAFAYGPSKAAIHQMTRVLAYNLGSRYITVNAIAPGPFESKMMEATLAANGAAIAASSPLGRIGRPDDIAGTVVYLSGRASSYVTGSVLAVDGGIATTAGRDTE
ncbi:SDR family oxidoreductase [Cumulibacter manganitolerans]|uniref:SDR family oxidoreductase n=1 Tax=Cumulibacter manganitolerans TaxID=1884992 RepID=UPI0012966774|nr:SDR family oxidoreductase [Cumulibacter manganitolerans]